MYIVHIVYFACTKGLNLENSPKGVNIVFYNINFVVFDSPIVNNVNKLLQS